MIELMERDVLWTLFVIFVITSMVAGALVEWNYNHDMRGIVIGTIITSVILGLTLAATSTYEVPEKPEIISILPGDTLANDVVLYHVEYQWGEYPFIHPAVTLNDLPIVLKNIETEGNPFVVKK